VWEILWFLAIASGLPSARHSIFSACEIERRPRGAHRELALAPTFVSGQSFLRDMHANALAHGSISRRTNKAVARAWHRRYWPETNVGASASSRCAPRGRRSIPQALQILWPTPVSPYAISVPGSPAAHSPTDLDCCPFSNNHLRQFVFFSYSFPYILPAAS
jgi:hypothetical protein